MEKASKKKPKRVKMNSQVAERTARKLAHLDRVTAAVDKKRGKKPGRGQGQYKSRALELCVELAYPTALQQIQQRGSDAFETE